MHPQVFNLIAQRDNHVNQSIAADSRELAAAAKRDGYAMKTIAVLTLTFLPGTFVAVGQLLSRFNFCLYHQGLFYHATSRLDKAASCLGSFLDLLGGNASSDCGSAYSMEYLVFLTWTQARANPAQDGRRT